MNRCLTVLSVLLAAAGTRADVNVTVGGLCESEYGLDTVKRIHEERLGDYNVLFVSKAWSPEVLRAVGDYCRAHKMRFTMDEMMDRCSHGLQPKYQKSAAAVTAVLKEYADVMDGALMSCEYGGAMWNWPASSVERGNAVTPSVKTYGEAEAYVHRRLTSMMAEAERIGIPRPYVSIEPASGPQAALLRGGIDRLDFEVLLDGQLERRYAFTLGAVTAYGKPTFGTDMAMVWYGGVQHDALWWARWRTSLYHAYLRGASPIYAEHGIMNYHAYGKRYEQDHPDVRRFRETLRDFAAFAAANPRADGLPRAAVAAIYGRHDGFVGGWQTHLWGQRGDEAFRVGAADDAWELFDDLYRRNGWEDRERWGTSDVSGNPPLGQARVVPHDTPDERLAEYDTLFFLGRNVMDDVLYERLVRYVTNGGKLLLTAAHLNAADAPGEAFRPYNDGDWSRLLGVRAVPGRTTRMPYGLKFCAEPGCGWRFPGDLTDSDPMFTDGGFAMPVLEGAGAQTLAVASDRFSDKNLTAGHLPVLYANKIGKGTVVFVPSLDSPGARGVKKLYRYLLARALEAVDVWPKVECSDRVRWSTYADGTVYLLNTEETLASEAVVRRSPDAPAERFRLAAGEFKALRPSTARTVPAASPAVELGGALGERFDLTIRGNILKLDVEKDFFTPFVERKEKGGFIGLGKLAEALVRFARYSDDPAVRALKDKVIAFILAHQQADGYTGCLRPESRLHELWDIHEMGFVIQALAADGELYGNRAALDGARKNADWLIANWSTLPKGWEANTVSDWLRTLGFNYGLTRLQAVTGDRRYGDFVRDVRGFADWNCPLVKGRSHLVKGHAYAYLGACLEQLQLYRQERDERLLRASRRALDFMLHGDGLLIDGAGGICECWTDDQDGEGHVGETCMVAYLLMFCQELLQLGVGDPAEIGDLMERTVYNALFAAQSRDGRQLRYYTPLNGVRQFWKGDLYCCPNNFRRAIARLPEFVFLTDEKGVTANLYTACRATVTAGGTTVKIREETDYPKSGRVTFALEPAEEKEFAFTVRLPRWCARPTVRVNGQAVSEPCRPGRPLVLTRCWRRGDTVELDLPMAVRAVRGRRRQAGRFAVMRGPVVYALDTRKIPEYKDTRPADVPTLMTMDPSQLREEDGSVYAFISTNSGQTGFPANLADGKLPPSFRQVKLEPFADEDNTLTYFRPPDQDVPAIADDGLLSGYGIIQGHGTERDCEGGL